MARIDLSDEEWTIIERLFPPQGRGPMREDERKILNRIFYVLRTGPPWRDLPERYGPRTTVYNRYNRWGERDVWRDIFEALAQECEEALVFVDASIVSAIPILRSISRTTSTLPSDDNAPPSKRADKSWLATGDRPGKNRVSSDTAGSQLELVADGAVCKPIHMFHQQLDLHPPTISKSVINNSG